VLVEADVVDAEEEAELVVSTVLDCMVTVKGGKMDVCVCERGGEEEAA